MVKQLNTMPIAPQILCDEQDQEDTSSNRGLLRKRALLKRMQRRDNHVCLSTLDLECNLVEQRKHIGQAGVSLAQLLLERRS